jgi:hypothetical protein
MKCQLPSEIKSISGRCGNIEYRTFKRPNGKTETRAYLLPRRANGKFGYERSTPLSAKEIASRNRFRAISDIINHLTDEQKTTYQREWKKAGYKFNGKKYATPRGYIMARLYDDAKKPSY